MDSLIFQYLRLEGVSYCDRHGNCLPNLLDSIMALISVTFIFHFLTSSLDSLQPDTFQETIQVVTFAFTNLAIRVFTFWPGLAFLGNKTLNLRLLKLKLSKPFQLSFYPQQHID